MRTHVIDNVLVNPTIDAAIVALTGGASRTQSTRAAGHAFIHANFFVILLGFAAIRDLLLCGTKLAITFDVIVKVAVGVHPARVMQRFLGLDRIARDLLLFTLFDFFFFKITCVGERLQRFNFQRIVFLKTMQIIGDAFINLLQLFVEFVSLKHAAIMIHGIDFRAVDANEFPAEQLEFFAE